MNLIIGQWASFQEGPLMRLGKPTRLRHRGGRGREEMPEARRKASTTRPHGISSVGVSVEQGCIFWERPFWNRTALSSGEPKSKPGYGGRSRPAVKTDLTAYELWIVQRKQCSKQQGDVSTCVQTPQILLMETYKITVVRNRRSCKPRLLRL